MARKQREREGGGHGGGFVCGPELPCAEPERLRPSQSQTEASLHAQCIATRPPDSGLNGSSFTTDPLPGIFSGPGGRRVDEGEPQPDRDV